MISVIVYGRNDGRGYEMSKRVALSLNAMASVIDAGSSEILFVDYNTEDHLPTLPELIRDSLTPQARRRLRVLRLRPSVHARFADLTPLPVLEPVARNVALRRSNGRNRWILSTNTDSIIAPRQGRSLNEIALNLDKALYGLPRFELPERVWEGMNRRDPASVIETAVQWGRDARLDEIVYGEGAVLFDGPGDFQLAPRSDLFAIDGFDEEMVLGWHVDHNLAHRLTLRLGETRSLLGEASLYHCGHARQATLTHSAARIENDVARFVDRVTQPDLPSQRERWGCPDDAIEEIDLERPMSEKLLKACRAIMPPTGAEGLASHFGPTSYDNFWYDAGHVATHVLDLLSSYPPDTVFGFAGVRRDFFATLRAGLSHLGFRFRMLVPESLSVSLGAGSSGDVQVVSDDDFAEITDVLVFEFGLLRDGDGRVRRGNIAAELTQEEGDALGLVEQLYGKAVATERALAPLGHRQRLFVTVNALHNRYEQSICRPLLATPAPFSTRLRYGKISLAEGAAEQTPLAIRLAEKLGYDQPVPAMEIMAARALTKALLSSLSAPDDRRLEIVALAPVIEGLVELDGAGLAPNSVETLRKRLRTYAAPDPRVRVAAGTAGAKKSLSKLASLSDWNQSAWNAGTERFADVNQRGKIVRSGWIWERGQLLWGLGQLLPGGRARRALVVCEHPDRFVGALDGLFDTVDLLDIRRLVSEGSEKFRRVSDFGGGIGSGRTVFDLAAMTLDQPPYDAIVIPHAAAFMRGVAGFAGFIGQLRPHLAPGGLLAIAGEVSQQGRLRLGRPTLDAGSGGLPGALERHAGLRLAGGPLQSAVDPRDAALVGEQKDLDAGRPVLALATDGDVLWPFVWFFEATGERLDQAGLLRAVVDGTLGEQLPAMSLGGSAVRTGEAIVADRERESGHVIFGPFLRLDAGDYVASIDVETNRAIEARTGAIVVAEVGLGPQIVVQKNGSSNAGGAFRETIQLPFTVDGAVAVSGSDQPCEVRLWAEAQIGVTIRSVRVERAKPLDVAKKR